MEDIKKADARIRYHINEILIRYMQHRKRDPEIKAIIKEIIREVQQKSTISSDPYP